MILWWSVSADKPFTAFNTAPVQPIPPAVAPAVTPVSGSVSHSSHGTVGVHHDYGHKPPTPIVVAPPVISSVAAPETKCVEHLEEKCQTIYEEVCVEPPPEPQICIEVTEHECNDIDVEVCVNVRETECSTSSKEV